MGDAAGGSPVECPQPAGEVVQVACPACSVAAGVEQSAEQRGQLTDPGDGSPVELGDPRRSLVTAEPGDQPVPPFAPTVPALVDGQEHRFVGFGDHRQELLGAGLFELLDSLGNRRRPAMEVLQEPVEMAEEQILELDEAGRVDVDLLGHPADDDVELRGSVGELAEDEIDLVERAERTFGIRQLSSLEQVGEQCRDLSEGEALELSVALAGVEHLADGAVGPFAEHRELEQRTASAVLLDRGDPRGVERALEHAPVGERVEGADEVLVVGQGDPTGGEPNGDVDRSLLDLVARLGVVERGEHGEIGQPLRRRRPTEQVEPLLDDRAVRRHPETLGAARLESCGTAQIRHRWSLGRFRSVRDAPIPRSWVGLIDGAARGGGAELLSALDYRIGSSRTVLGQPEVPMGILPGAGETTPMPRRSTQCSPDSSHRPPRSCPATVGAPEKSPMVSALQD